MDRRMSNHAIVAGRDENGSREHLPVPHQADFLRGNLLCDWGSRLQRHSRFGYGSGTTVHCFKDASVSLQVVSSSARLTHGPAF